MNTPIARSLVVSSTYRYASASSHTNVEIAEVALANGTWPTRMVSMPMTKVCANAARTSSTVAMRLVPNVRRSRELQEDEAAQDQWLKEEEAPAVTVGGGDGS